MPKLPKFSELTDIQGMMGKVKSAIDSVTGPGSSAATEEALAQEKDPVKAKLLEIELLINQLNDVQIIQTKTLAALKSKYPEVKKLVESKLVEETPAEAPAAKEPAKETPQATPVEPPAQTSESASAAPPAEQPPQQSSSEPTKPEDQS